MTTKTAAGATTSLTEFVQCPICLDDYDATRRVPRMLACQHSLCSVCLHNLFAKSPPLPPNANSHVSSHVVTECPMCREPIAASCADKVPKNRFILQYLETITNTNSSNSNQQHQPHASQYYPPSASAPPPPSQHTQNSQRWDEKSYFRSIFDGIDLNRNGEIDQRELHEALRLGQPTLTFDPATVRLLIHKYDSNRDERVNFNEFYGLFVDINNQYNEFLDIDADCSGSIDARELAAALQRKRYPLSAAFYDRLVAMIAERTRSRALSFDLYVRVIARLDFLLRVCRERGNDRNMEAFILHEFLVHF